MPATSAGSDLHTGWQLRCNLVITLLHDQSLALCFYLSLQKTWNHASRISEYSFPFFRTSPYAFDGHCLSLRFLRPIHSQLSQAIVDNIMAASSDLANQQCSENCATPVKTVIVWFSLNR